MRNALKVRDLAEPHSTGLSHRGDLEWALHGGASSAVYSIPAKTRAEAKAEEADEPAPAPFAHVMLPSWARDKAA